MATAKANKINSELTERLAKIEGKQDLLKQTIESNHALVLAKLEPVLELKATVASHEKQIQFWRGANTVLASIGTILFAWLLKIKNLL